MDLISIITALAGLFVIIGIGFAAKKYGILNGDRLHLISDETPDLAIRQTTQQLEASGVHVLSAREDRFSLEDVFISIVEKARLEGKVAIES